MDMKKILFGTFLLFAFVMSSAQAPGYMGKRMYFTGGAYLFPIIVFDDGFVHRSALDFELEANYSVNKYGSLGFQCAFGKYKSVINEVISDNFNTPVEITLNDYHIRRFSLGFNYTFYTKGFISPIGRYVKLFVNYNFTSSKDFLESEKQNLDFFFSNVNVWDDIVKKEKHTSIGMDIGRNYILKDDFTFDIGFRLNWMFINNGLFNDYYGYDQQDVDLLIQSAFNRYESRLFNRMYLGMYLKVGILQ